MNLRRHRALSLLTLGSLSTVSASAQVFITDNFEGNSSANYTVVNDGTPDGTTNFAFDYVAAGLPLAPRSQPGSSKGLRFTVNDTAGAVDALTAFHNTAITAPHYRLTVDVWMNFIVGGFTTEHAHVGVGGDGLTFNQLFSPISGSGAYIAFDGDGGSNSDYRWFRSPLNTPPGETANTTLPNTHPSYLGNGSNNSGTFFQNLFPSPPASIAGSPGNVWTTVTIDVDNVNGVISFFFDGVLTFQGDFANTFDGLVSLGYADTFTSLSGALDVYALYDNFVVDVPPPSMGIGTPYCSPAVVNTSGNSATLRASGSALASANNLTLVSSDMPANQFGFFLTSMTQGNIPNPGGSQGVLCLSGTIGRYVGAGQIMNGGAGGTFSLPLNLTQTPAGPVFVAISAGQTWNFQAWFRDIGPMGQPWSNFTDGLSVTFQ